MSENQMPPVEVTRRQGNMKHVSCILPKIRPVQDIIYSRLQTCFYKYHKHQMPAVAICRAAKSS
jgi:hypothetical protein